MVGHRRRRQLVGEIDPPGTHAAMEPVTKRITKIQQGHLVQKRIADPIGVDDPPVERVSDARGLGNQLQIGHGPIKGSAQSSDVAVGIGSVRSVGVLDQARPVFGTAVSELVRRKGIPRKEKGSVDHSSTRWAGREPAVENKGTCSDNDEPEAHKRRESNPLESGANEGGDDGPQYEHRGDVHGSGPG